MTDQDKQSISTISADDRRNSTASSNTSITAGGNRQNHQHHRRNRANIQLDENSHLNVLRNWNHLLLQSEMNCSGQNERPMAVVGGIGRTTLGEINTNEENGANGLTDENVTSLGGSTFVRATAIPHCQHTDWEALREFRVQEMNEIRQRAAHMENTMRWWLLSAEQWRERWMLAKGERNRLREENVRLRAALAKVNAELRTMGSRKDGKDKVTTKSNNKESNEKQMAKIDEEMKGQKKNQKMALERSNSF